MSKNKQSFIALNIHVHHKGSTQGLLVKNVTLQYRKNLPPSLINISFSIAPGERVAVVGRTGAGKSSLAVAIFQLAEVITGSIILKGKELLAASSTNSVVTAGGGGGATAAGRAAGASSIPDVVAGDHFSTKEDAINLNTTVVSTTVEEPCLGIDEARRMCGIITQDPVVFGGDTTIRYNLDPFLEFSDEDCQSALDAAQLGKRLKLSDIVDDGAANLSLGERQLLCLARVLLRRPKLLVCDEATASCDARTDKQVQEAISHWVRVKNPDCCVLTVAHRLDTIVDYDRILVLEKGRIAEVGTVPELLRVENGYFAKLVSHADAQIRALFEAKLVVGEQGQNEGAVVLEEGACQVQDQLKA
ncbi:unnamed protein product [Amoebophrya sp. A25]|nr:unnamed protein product [Amoebophrya sp. A25]|eukprot:GSA25T00017042001.1